MASIDLSRIRELMGDEEDRDLIAALVEIFREESPRQLEKLGDAIRAKDARAVREAAHAIKSSALNLGINRLASLAAEVEVHGKGGALDPCPALFAEIQKEAAQALHELQNLPELKAA